jgi:hypothetical protein
MSCASLLLGACSKELGRGRAAELVQANEKFKATHDVEIAVGRLWYDWRNLYSAYDYKPLAERGVLTVKESGKSYAMWWKEYFVELTPNGSALAKGWIKTNEKPASFLGPQSPGATVFRIPLAQRELVSVTGITSDPGGKEAGIEFDWKWMPMKQSEVLPERLPSAELQHGEAAARLYDDGWRIERIGL